MARKPTDLVQLTLRLREDLRRRLERAADKAERSLNIEIVERLAASFEQEQRSRELEEIRTALEEQRQRLSAEIRQIHDQLEAQRQALVEEYAITRGGDEELRTTIRESIKEALGNVAQQPNRDRDEKK